MTFPKAVVLILKHATSLCHSMSPGPALIQADLDYQTAGVEKKVQQHLMASQRHSAELDSTFIMAIEMVCLFCACSNCTKLLFPISGATNVIAEEGLFFGTGILTHDTVVAVQR